MKVPLSWLAEFVEVRPEPRRLAEDLTLAGLAVDAVETHGDDAVLDIDVTTNRVDCMNVYGVAREVAVLYGVALRPLALDFTESGPPAAQALDVTIEAADLCPRFCARVLDVRMGPAPAWIRDRLEMVGVRPINNVVDLTNYVLMEMGQPSHAFDLAKIPGGGLNVRWRREAETLTTLDGVQRTLAGRIGVVAGVEGALALAGVMGGASSEVSEATRTVALEAAYWEPLAIRRAARALGMHTEASHRFERGADPEGTVTATARIAHLLQKIGAGTTRPGLIDRVAAPLARRSVLLRPAKMRVVLGIEVPEQRAHAILEGLGFGRADGKDHGTTFTVPTWRSDVTREADLIEEVGRHHGLDKVPSTVPPARGAEGLRTHQVRERAVREILAGFGLTEVVNYAFVASAAAEPDPSPRVRLANPLSADQDVLRSSLVVPGLGASLKTNLSHGRRDVRLFEMGRVFAPASGGVVEERRLGILLAGAARLEHWSEKRRTADVYDVKGILEGLAERLGVGPFRFEPESALGFLHPGKTASVFMGEQRIGWLGALHPDLAERWEVKDETLAAEIALERLMTAAAATPRFQPLPRFPEVTRDLSIVCDTTLAARAILERIRSAGGEWLKSAAVTDRYEGRPVPEGKVSLTVALRFQDPERTLTGDEVQAAVERIVASLRHTGADIRGE
jgi:phenylalanyl-tRNA synthetase beta chain